TARLWESRTLPEFSLGLFPSSTGSDPFFTLLIFPFQKFFNDDLRHLVDDQTPIVPVKHENAS
ncbi:MAG: hypothetical protein ACYCVG_09280, partial [Leptospirillum sp.]